MYDKFKKHYLVLAKKPLSTTQRGILFGAGAVLAFAAFALPVAAVGGISAPAATTTGALALIGDMQIGVGMAGLLTFLVGGGLMGTTYKLLDSYNKREVMREFRKLDYKEVAQLFSEVLLRIDHAQKNNVKFSVQRIC